MTPVSLRSSPGPGKGVQVQEDASRAEPIAAALVAARRRAQPLAAFPAQLPATLADAYRIQDAAIRLMPDVIAGWKVGRILPPLTDRFGADRLAGPIFSRRIVHDNGGDWPAGGMFEGGFGAAEAEFELRLARTPASGKSQYTLDEAAALVDRVHVGIEIASSPLASVNDLGPAVIAADFGNNNGLVLGAEVVDWRSLNAYDWTVVTLIDGIEAGQGTASAMPDGPIGAVRFLLELCAARGIVLPAGTWVSTGAITGVHAVRPGQRVEARFGGSHVVRCRIAAVSPELREKSP